MSRPYFHLIMPFGSDSRAGLKQEIIRDVAEIYCLRPHFPAYDKNKSAFVLAPTLEDLKECAFVLADLSLERASCYYELGVAEALGKKTYVVAEEGTDIHQTASRNS